MAGRRRPLAECPHCGGTFPRGRPACPHCGSDAETGWKSEEEIEAASVDADAGELGEQDYRDFLAAEGLGPPETAPQDAPSGPLMPLIVIVLLAAAALLLALLS